MNSVEIAKKLIDGNKTEIEYYRQMENDSVKRISELEKKVKNQNMALELLYNSLKEERRYLETIRAEKKEYLIDNLALQQFIANGGGLDMLDED